MSVTLKVGARLRSQVGSTEIIVVRVAEVALTAGGHPMLFMDEEPKIGLEPVQGHDGDVPAGKRYVLADTPLEVLVTKAGSGVLAADGKLLSVKDSKSLPASD